MASDLDPPSDVLLELGRLVWAAINLEGDVYAVCRSIRPRDPEKRRKGRPGREAFDDLPIGTVISHAFEDLGTWPPSDLRSRAEAWLANARDALEERNAVVQSTPVTYAAIPGEVPVDPPPGPELMNFPRSGERPMVRTSLTVDGLGEIRRRTEAPQAESLTLGGELWRARP